jgi:hypothetical protein
MKSIQDVKGTMSSRYQCRPIRRDLIAMIPARLGTSRASFIVDIFNRRHYLQPAAQLPWPRDWYLSPSEPPRGPRHSSRGLNGGRSASRAHHGTKVARSMSCVHSYSVKNMADTTCSIATRPKTTSKFPSNSPRKMRNSSKRSSPATPRNTRRPP